MNCYFTAATAAFWAVAASAQAAAVTNTPQSIADLQAQIEAHITSPRFARAIWGIKIVSLESGTILYKHRSDRLMSPASNSKLFVGALALERFGGDYCIKTPIMATTRPDKRGTIKGNLFISGRGDPSWKPSSGETNFWRIFDPFVNAITNAGVRKVTGDLVADATHFVGPPQGGSWTVDDLEDSKGAEISAITLLANCAELRVTSATDAGRACQLEFQQPHTGLTLVNHTTTTTNGGEAQVVMRRVFGENTLHFFGTLPPGTNVVLNVPVPRPALWFGHALKEALTRHGVRIEGEVRMARWPEPSPIPTNCIPLAEVSSPPVRELVKAFMNPSQNLETDLIFAHVGEATRTAETPAWRTSEQLAVAALEAFSLTNNLPAGELFFDEGSGLSRNNVTTANAILGLLERMTRHPAAEDFLNSLPVAGVDGTLRNRMQGTLAEGNVKAKTGTLRWVNALSGYVTTAANERLAFSLLLNRNVSVNDRSGRDDLDTIAVMLANLAARSDTSISADPAGEENKGN